MQTVLIQRNGETLARVWNANRYFLRLRGLLGRTIPSGGGLLLTPCNDIHTFGIALPHRRGVSRRCRARSPRGRLFAGR